MRKLAVLLGSSVATIHGSWKIENQVKKTHPGVSAVESPPGATFHHSVPHTNLGRVCMRETTRIIAKRMHAVRTH